MPERRLARSADELEPAEVAANRWAETGTLRALAGRQAQMLAASSKPP